MRADSSDNVVSLFNRKPSDKVTKKDKESSDEIEESSDLFSDIIKKNFETRERMRKERNKANKGVIRSYRLKK